MEISQMEITKMFDKQANKKLYTCYKNIQSMGTYIFQIFKKKSILPSCFFKYHCTRLKKMLLYSRAIVIFSKNSVPMFVSRIFPLPGHYKMVPCHPLNMSFKKYPLRKVKMYGNTLITQNLITYCL